MRPLRFLVTGAVGLIAAAEAQTVQTTNGTIQGGKCDSTDVNYYFSIPFAEPPIGNLRYTAPRPFLNSYRGILDGTSPAPSCIQFSSTYAETGPQSEDCLFLDVWAPSSATPDSKLPVKVWIYGGSNEAGGISDVKYTGCFTAVDSIFVSINYRVGPLGYLALSNLGLNGNFGVQDQLLGLRWVQENIAAFGGDPSKVLLFGQSAGSTDTFVLATLPQAPGLFRAAAMESGGGRNPPTVANVQKWQTTFINGLNCSVIDISCARHASTLALQEAANSMPKHVAPGAYTPFDFQGARTEWGPLVDGQIIPVAPGSVPIKVPAIFGSNTRDGELFVFGAYKNRTLKLTQSDYNSFLQSNFGPLASTVNKTFSLAKFDGSVEAAMSTIVTEVSYKCSAYRGLLNAQESGTPVWAYEFFHAPTCAWSGTNSSVSVAYLRKLGATHTAEIPFVFNTTYNLPLPAGNCTFTDKEQALAAAMSRVWTNMAEFGNVGDEAVWPQWTAKASAGVNIVHTMVVGTVDYSRCSFWDEIDAASVKIAYGT